jgi:hypothetical protein
VVQVGAGMNGRRKCFDYVRSFQDLCPERATAKGEEWIGLTPSLQHLHKQNSLAMKM